jgi:thiol-disulfide isomerase/thioredoxin
VTPRRLLLVGLLSLVVVVLVGYGLKPKSSNATRPAPALPSRALVAPGVDAAQLRGHVTVVNFWASWCHPCRKEAPQLERFQHHLGTARLVAIDTGDNAADARRFAKRYAWHFPLLRDADGTVATRFNVPGLPTTFVLDTRGRIVKQLSGPQTTQSLSAAVAGLG